MVDLIQTVGRQYWYILVKINTKSNVFSSCHHACATVLLFVIVVFYLDVSACNVSIWHASLLILGVYVFNVVYQNCIHCCTLHSNGICVCNLNFSCY